jgi:hypothetical protein
VTQKEKKLAIRQYKQSASVKRGYRIPLNYIIKELGLDAKDHNLEVSNILSLGFLLIFRDTKPSIVHVFTCCFGFE